MLSFKRERQSFWMEISKSSLQGTDFFGTEREEVVSRTKEILLVGKRKNNKKKGYTQIPG